MLTFRYVNNLAQTTGTLYLLEHNQAHSFVLEKCLYMVAFRRAIRCLGFLIYCGLLLLWAVPVFWIQNLLCQITRNQWEEITYLVWAISKSANDLSTAFVEMINNLLAIHNLVDNFCLFYLLMKCLWVDHNFLIFIIHCNYLLNNFCKQFLFCSSLPLWMFIIQNLVSETNYLSHILDFVQCLPEHCSYNQRVLLQYELKLYSSVNTPSVKFIC